MLESPALIQRDNFNERIEWLNWVWPIQVLYSCTEPIQEVWWSWVIIQFQIGVLKLYWVNPSCTGIDRLYWGTSCMHVQNEDCWSWMVIQMLNLLIWGVLSGCMNEYPYPWWVVVTVSPSWNWWAPEHHNTLPLLSGISLPHTILWKVFFGP